LSYRFPLPLSPLTVPVPPLAVVPLHASTVASDSVGTIPRITSLEKVQTHNHHERQGQVHGQQYNNTLLEDALALVNAELVYVEEEMHIYRVL